MKERERERESFFFIAVSKCPTIEKISKVVTKNKNEQNKVLISYYDHIYLNFFFVSFSWKHNNYGRGVCTIYFMFLFLLLSLLFIETGSLWNLKFEIQIFLILLFSFFALFCLIQKCTKINYNNIIHSHCSVCVVFFLYYFNGGIKINREKDWFF